jgi:hypothetical protein
MQNRALIISGHLFGGLLFLCIPLILAPGPFSFDAFHHPRTREELLSYIFLLGFFYLNYYKLIPALYFSKKKTAYYLTLATSLSIILFIPRLLFHRRPPPELQRPFPFPQHRFFDLFELSHHIFLFLVIVFFSMVIYINSKWRQAVEEKITAELAFLKAQVNPHFLFNTLNGIYSLALQKSDDTPEAIVKLSGLMRYVLTEAKDEFVPLHKEIDYIKNYIALQKIRLGNTASVAFEVQDDHSGQQIAPLLLIPFIENAFKHGVNPEESSDIRVSISIYRAKLELTVANKKVHVANATESTGTGLENSRLRLQHTYADRHELIINDSTKEYKTILRINLC